MNENHYFQVQELLVDCEVYLDSKAAVEISCRIIMVFYYTELKLL